MLHSKFADKPYAKLKVNLDKIENLSSYCFILVISMKAEQIRFVKF